MASRHWLPPCARPSLVSRATAESWRTPVTPDERQAIAAECAEAAREIADLMHRLDRLARNLRGQPRRPRSPRIASSSAMISEYAGDGSSSAGTRRTKVPRFQAATTPSRTSCSTARLTVAVATPYCLARLTREGSLSPVFRRPEETADRRSSAICAYSGRGSSRLRLTWLSVVGPDHPGLPCGGTCMTGEA
jgi:hypothetical protein